VPQIRVAVFTDDRLLCDGLSHIIGADSGLTTVGAGNGALAPFPRIPDAEVFLVDSRVPAALELCSTLKREGGRPVILFMAARDDEAWAVEALFAGARGILARDVRSEELIKAIRLVHQGQIWARRQTIEAWAERMIVGAPESARIAALEQGLSNREREVLRHAATGLSNKELAGRLAISEATVKVHLTHIFQKLGVRGRAELAAAYHGLLTSASDAGGGGLRSLA
jgi:DNA-binding NarL/FixJ family response regulator